MGTGFLPYATTPGRAGRQALADLLVAVWVLAWAVVGYVVHWLISGFAAAGRAVRDGAGGVAGNLDQAGGTAGEVPLVGDKLGAPLRGAGNAARQIADVGAGLDEKATVLAWVLAIAIALPPILTVVVPWLWLRLRFARRAAATVALARTPGGERLLAMRALTDRPLPQLLALSDDPVGDWRAEDPEMLHRLAALELRASGLKAGRRVEAVAAQ
jgi:hypothetical protein